MTTSLPVLSCDDCGACCTEQTALPVHLVGDYFRLDPCSPLPLELARELRREVERYQRDGWPEDGSPCIWYDANTKRCRHYEHRPTICRDAIQPGDEACLRWREGH